MSLLAQMNQPNGNLVAGNPQYYFARTAAPGSNVVSAEGFVATGGTEVGPVGQFRALGNAPPGGSGMFEMFTPASVIQWGIGIEDVPAGGNSGNNMAIFAYDDTGAFTSAPMKILRDTGVVQFPEPIEAPNVPTAANRVASASFVPDAITINPSAAIFTLNAASMPDLADIIANPAVNIIQLFSQFGIQTTAGQPKMNLGLTFQADGGGALLTNGTVCLGQSTPPAAGSPSECPYVLYANLVRGIHFTNATTSIVVAATADTTPSGAVITLVNNDDNAGTPTSPSVVITALGLA